MTEEEAKTKWCPIKRDGASSNLGPSDYISGHNRCEGAGCMMWREDVRMADEFSDGRIVLRKIGKRYGYCGLAGK